MLLSLTRPVSRLDHNCMNTTEVRTYPQPPQHYAQFGAGPTALQPPDISALAPTYRMFGQVVQNPLVAANAHYALPPIDRDVIVYDPKQGVKKEVIRLVSTLAESVLTLLSAIQNKPNQSGPQVRDFDNRVKSIFHALEVLRPHEARETIVRVTEGEIQIREAVNAKCAGVIEKANKLLSS